MTNRDFLSIIWNNTKSLGVDSFLPPKTVLQDSETIIGKFLKQDRDSFKKLYTISEGWSEIRKFPMIEVPYSECDSLGLPQCQKLMRSKYKLPETYSSKTGNIIEYVANLPFSTFYEPKSPKEWNAIQKRQDIDKSRKYTFIIQNYLYIPIFRGETYSPEFVRIKAYFKKAYEVDRLNAECEGNLCAKPLDSQFVCPAYLEEDVKITLLKQYADVYLRTVPDEYPNLNMDKNNQRDLQNGKN